MSEVLKLEMNGSGNTFTDSSASGHTITAVGNATQVKTAITNSRQAYFFDGDSDYITIPDSADWDLCGSTSQDYTVDFWIYPKAQASNIGIIHHYEDASNFWQIGIDDTNKYRIQCTTGGSNVINIYSDADVIGLNSWHHVAITKVTSAGPTVEWGIYVDSVQVGYGSDTSTDTFTGDLYIGKRVGYSYVNGHMKNIRISTSNVFSAAPNVGKTDTITVPTADPIADANTKLLLTANTPSLNSPLCSTAYFDGTDDYLTVPDHADWDFAGDFTVELRVRLNAISTNNVLLGNCDYDNGSDGWTLDYNNDGTLRFYAMYSGSWGISASQTFNLAVNRWYHIAISRDGTDGIRFFKDGALVGTTADAGPTAVTGTANDLIIGRNTSGTNDVNGYIKEIRISGSARYTAAFIPSTTPFSDDADTRLLLHLDGTPDDSDNTNGWLTDTSGTHTVTATASLCKYIEDYRNTIVADTSGQAHTGVMVGTAKNDWICVQGNGAGAFDGTGDYLSMPDAAAFDIAVNADFTMGAWVRLTTIGDNDIMGCKYTDGYMWTVNATLVQFWADNAKRAEVAFVFRANEWYYINCVRESDDIHMYANGSLIDTADTYADAMDCPNTFRVAQDEGDNKPLRGNMDYVFFDNGTALYTAAFIPPVYEFANAGKNAFRVMMF